MKIAQSPIALRTPTGCTVSYHIRLSDTKVFVVDEAPFAPTEPAKRLSRSFCQRKAARVRSVLSDSTYGQQGPVAPSPTTVCSTVFTYTTKWKSVGAKNERIQRFLTEVRDLDASAETASHTNSDLT